MFKHIGFYVNFQSSFKGYFTIGNYFKKLTKRELAEVTYEFLSENSFCRDVFLKKYSK